MKCKKGDRVTMNDGKTDYVMHGTDKDDGIISVLEFCERYGHTERVGRLATDIVKMDGSSHRLTCGVPCHKVHDSESVTEMEDF